MKKRFLSLLCCFVLLASAFCFVACGDTELKEFENITFADSTIEYDGESHSLAVSGAPDFATVSYNQNGFVREGTYIITAYVMADGYKTWQKSATLKITPSTTTSSNTDDFRFTYNGEGYTLIGYDGEASNVVIPATYKGKPVTQIGDGYYTGVFYNKPFITSISVPISVTDIRFADFHQAENLVYNEYKGGKYLGTAESPYNVLVTTDANTFTGDIHDTVRAIYNITYIGNSYDGQTKGVEKIVIPDGVKHFPLQVNLLDGEPACVLIPNGISVEGVDALVYGRNNGESGIIVLKPDYNLERITWNSIYGGIGYWDTTAVVMIPKSVKYIDEMVFSDRSIHRVIYYGGSPDDWREIEIGEDNYALSPEALEESTFIIYYSETQPTDAEHTYWRYVDGIPKVWTN